MHPSSSSMGAQMIGPISWDGNPALTAALTIVKPELGFHIAAADVDMRRFAAFVGIEEAR
jgi:hypothetical protein